MLSLIMLLISISSFSQVCKFSQASQGGGLVEEKTIKENESFSYFDKGESLHQFTTQDQDGLGTCYANALTAALKTTLPGHEDVSYLYASFLGSKDDYDAEKKILRKKKVEVNGDEVEVDELFNYGGRVCETFEAMKSQGGACLSEYSIVENDPNQKKILSALGKYLDYFNPENTSEKKQFEKEFELLFDKSKEMKDLKKKECEEKKQLGFIPLEALSKPLKYRFHQPNESECSESINNLIRSFFNDPKEDSFDAFLGEPTNEFSLLVKQVFGSYEVISSLADSYESNDKSIQVKSFFDFLEAKLKEKMENKNCLDESIFPESSREYLFNTLNKEWGEFLTLDCSQSNLSFDELSNDDSSCLNDDTLPIALDLLNGFEEISNKLGDHFLKDLRKSKLDSSLDLLSEELMPGCQKKKKLISLDDLTCSGVRAFSGWKNICDSDGNCKYGVDKDEVKLIYQDRIFSSLANKKGLTVSVCTSFMRNSTYSPSNFCERKSDGIDGHSYHAMSLTGYRCVNGKIQYQIQNSWGKNCPPAAGTSYKNDFMECDLDSSGEPRGSFWVDEEVLFDSTIEIDSID